MAVAAARKSSKSSKSSKGKASTPPAAPPMRAPVKRTLAAAFNPNDTRPATPRPRLVGHTSDGTEVWAGDEPLHRVTQAQRARPTPASERMAARVAVPVLPADPSEPMAVLYQRQPGKPWPPEYFESRFDLWAIVLCSAFLVVALGAGYLAIVGGH